MVSENFWDRLDDDARPARIENRRPRPSSIQFWGRCGCSSAQICVAWRQVLQVAFALQSRSHFICSAHRSFFHNRLVSILTLSQPDAGTCRYWHQLFAICWNCDELCFYINLSSVQLMIFLLLIWGICAPNQNAGTRITLLFKDGITQPAAAISAPNVIESVLVECTSEGVCSPQKIIPFASSRQSLRATFPYLLCGMFACEGVCGKEAWKMKKSHLV